MGMKTGDKLSESEESLRTLQTLASLVPKSKGARKKRKDDSVLAKPGALAAERDGVRTATADNASVESQQTLATKLGIPFPKYVHDDHGGFATLRGVVAATDLCMACLTCAGFSTYILKLFEGDMHHATYYANNIALHALYMVSFVAHFFTSRAFAKRPLEFVASSMCLCACFVFDIVVFLMCLNASIDMPDTMRNADTKEYGPYFAVTVACTVIRTAAALAIIAMSMYIVVYHPHDK